MKSKQSKNYYKLYNKTKECYEHKTSGATTWNNLPSVIQYNEKVSRWHPKDVVEIHKFELVYLETIIPY